VSKKALGKGIDALFLSDENKAPEARAAGMSVTGASGTGASAAGGPGILNVPIGIVRPNPAQPRKHFPEETLAELAASIKQQGVLQPVLVEEEAGAFSIVAGERRYRAAILAGLSDLPVIVKKFTEEEKLEIALIENIQREDLTPIEEAKAIRNIIEKTGRKQEEVAEKLGKNRSTVANALRLLKLPKEIQDTIDTGEISAGHARAILSLVNPADQTLLFQKILADALSVRQAEQLALQYGKGNKAPAKEKEKKAATEPRQNRELARVQESLIGKLGTKVTIKGTETAGTIEIQYYSMEDLDRLLEIIGQ